MTTLEVRVIGAFHVCRGGHLHHRRCRHVLVIGSVWQELAWRAACWGYWDDGGDERHRWQWWRLVPLQQVRVARLDALEGVSTCATLQGRGVMAYDVQNGPYTAG